MKLAIDNQVSKDVARRLNRKHEVVVWAGSRADEDWIEEALDLGAEVFISPDLDVPNYLDRAGSDAIWIDIPQNLREKDQFEFLTKKLELLKVRA